MSRSTMMLLWSLLVLTAGFLLALDGCGGSGGSNPLPMPRPSSGKIQHVVVIFQENRTPDNLFHGLPNADIANSGLNSKGQTIPLVPISLVTGYDLGHTHSSFTIQYDSGKMDGADKNSVGCAPGVIGCAPPNPEFMYVSPSEVAPYFQMAERYTFADRMFQTNQGPSRRINSLFPEPLPQPRRVICSLPKIHSRRLVQVAQGVRLLPEQPSS